MNKYLFEDGVCFLCDYWWVLLILIVLAIVAYFTRNLWLPIFALI